MTKKHPTIKISGEFSDELCAKLLSSRKYRGLDIPETTIKDLIDQASSLDSDPKVIEQTVREKLHNLVATYLGDPDYSASRIALDDAYASREEGRIKKVCLEILTCHASTKERIPILNEFFSRLFAKTGTPASIMDLACGLNPFALPWMGLASGTRYYAYDLHQPRLDLINHFLELNKMEPLAIHQDILVEPPNVECDVAFFFKEAHRFEQRRRGCNRDFWQSFKCKYLLVSLPTASLTARHPKLEQHRKLVMKTVEGLPWKVSEIEFSDEIVFCIEK